MMKILLLKMITLIQVLLSETTYNHHSSLEEVDDDIYNTTPFQHRADTNLNTKQDSDDASTDLSSLFLYGAVAGIAIVIVLPAVVMGVFYLWMLYWFSCKGRSAYTGKAFGINNLSNLVMNDPRKLDNLSEAVTVAEAMWRNRCY